MSASLTETSPPNAAACGSVTVTYDHAHNAMGRRVAERVNDAGYGWSDWQWYFYDGLKVIAEGTGTNERQGVHDAVALSLSAAKQICCADRTRHTRRICVQPALIVPVLSDTTIVSAV